MKLFVVSDIHGHYNELKAALDEVAFIPDKDHLIVLGDLLDRGRQPNEVIDFLLSLPNKTLIKGNHEEYFEEACQRGCCRSFDGNGVQQTILDLVGLSAASDLRESHFSEAYNKFKPILDLMVPFAESRNFVFVHSWLPVKETENGYYYVDPLWRKSDKAAWSEMHAVSPLQMIENKLFPPDKKTLVFGHWSTSIFRDEGDSDTCSLPVFGENYIAIDACTTRSGRINCLVIEDELI